LYIISYEYTRESLFQYKMSLEEVSISKTG